MFNVLEALPPDPILGLTAAFKKDARTTKVDLGVGVYKTEDGRTPVMRAVKAAEQRLFDEEDTKSYIAQVGVEAYNDGMIKLILGAGHNAVRDGRVRSVLTPGGTGALRIGAEAIKRMNPTATVWVGDPTWANHFPVIQGAGLKTEIYPYYDQASRTIRIDDMLATLADRAAPGDAVLLHGCCHNPCGADLTLEHWQQIAELLERKGLLPYVDLAYQGFGTGLDEDAQGIRLLADKVPDVLVVSSCSKNFGLYRERTGSITAIAQSADKAGAAESHFANIARAIYSMPPAHGGFLAGMVLQDEQLRAEWVAELTEMRDRKNGLRALFVSKMAEKTPGQDFSFIQRQFGMFSFLGINHAQIARLRDEFGIYVVGSSRINIAGISEANIDYLTDSLAVVLAD
jgi:aspartate aminotransferase